ncbi:ribosomal protein S18-alanine N-acetyltransferase [Hyphobacterium sp.]|uniref:ribosomal protein S18-alanine N-acetyltransferase n=1 Tax=Hyphobacterium sp. TaxID=2004662 RepID=UPI003BABCD26
MIQEAAKSECGILAAIHAECFPRGWSGMEFAALIAQPGVFALKWGDASLTGFILVRCVADEAEILTLAVDPASRGNGLGRALVKQAEAESLSRGCTRFFLEVSDQNAPAIALYEQLGFEPSGRRANYYSDGSDARIMEKALPR